MENNTVTFWQMNPTIRDFLNEVRYDEYDKVTSNVSEYVARETAYDKSKPCAATITLPCPGKLTVRDGYTGISYSVDVESGDITISNLTPGVNSTYTLESNGEVVASGALHPIGALRMIDCADGASNVRDLGGWRCDGGHIKYGKLFRGSEIKESIGAREILVNRCGVRAELELRGISERRSKISSFGEDIRYFIPDEHQYYTVSSPHIWRELLRYAFDCVERNMPLYFHCAAGADRTGSFACILEAILGVSKSDIDLDYELTDFFEVDQRLRNGDRWRGLMHELYEELPPRRSFRDRIICWLGSLGFTSDEINSFRRNMIDGNPEEIDLAKLNDVKVLEYRQENPSVKAFISEASYKASEINRSEISNYTGVETDYDKALPSGITIETKGGTLKIHDRGSHTFFTVTGDYISGLTPDVYSEYFVERDGKTVDFGLIRPLGSLRMIDCADGAVNVRDIGGWRCDGGYVRYNKIIRGSQVENAVSAKEILVDRCGIRAELDLKGNMYSWAEKSELGDNIKYLRPENCQWYTIGDAELWRTMLGFIFECASQNLPIYLHCAGGADRTGTVAAVIEAILGVSLEDIEKDLELTNFADTDRYPTRNMPNWRRFVNEVNSLTYGKDFNERIIGWVGSLGFTSEEINSFRRRMIDGDPETVDLDRINSATVIRYCQMNPSAAAYLSEVSYDVTEHEITVIKDYVDRQTPYDKAKPVSALIRTAGGTLHIRDRYTDIEWTEEVDAGVAQASNICPDFGADYTVSRNGVVTERGVIKPTGFLRMIDCGEAVENVRDLGGWECDGGRIKYGKIFRGALFADIPGARKALVERCGIRAELNLRGADESRETTSLLGEDVLYCRPTNCQWYTIGDPDIWREILRFIFDCVRDGLPLYFHCAGGADRTGTCACIIEAMLGVSHENIEKDYELTNFAHTECSRLRTRKGDYQWGNLMDEIAALTTGDTFRDRIIAWVVSLGFDIDEINSFRRSMINGDPSDVSLPL